MEYRRLGKSGLQVSALSLGSWLTFGSQIGDDVAEDLMKLAYDQGVNFFDNAEGYAGGRSEIVMGNILKKMGWRRSSFVVSSKVYFGADGGRKDLKPNETGLSRKHVIEACCKLAVLLKPVVLLSRKHVIEACHEAMQRLQVDYLDLYFCHRPDKNTPIEETVWAMNILIQQGKILYWGTSEWSAQEITEAHVAARQNNLIGPLMEQPQYNMFHRERFEVEYKRLFENFGMGSTIWSPLASGVLTPKYLSEFPEGTRLGKQGLAWLKKAQLTEERLEKTRQLNTLAQELDTTLPKLAVAWCLKNPQVSTVILGASKPAQLSETLDSVKVTPQLTEEVMGRIEAILQNKPAQPEW